MTNTIALPVGTNPVSSILSHIGSELKESTSVRKHRAGIQFRRIVAIALLAVASILSLSWSADSSIAKKLRHVKSRWLNGHQFRLLSIYNGLKSANPSLIEAMNNARSGLASWYGGMFHGRKTAMGTRYDMYAMTAAHRSLPLGTWVQVTNESNGKSAVVQVTDRGPYVANRIMDLSYAAAQKLGYAHAGTTKISMKVLGNTPDIAANTPDVSAGATSTSSDMTSGIGTAVMYHASTQAQNMMPTTGDSTSRFSALLSGMKKLASRSSVAMIGQLHLK